MSAKDEFDHPVVLKRLRVRQLIELLLCCDTSTAPASLVQTTADRAKLHSTGSVGDVLHLNADKLRADARGACRATVISAYYVCDVLKDLLDGCGEVRVLLNGLGGRRLEGPLCAFASRPGITGEAAAWTMPLPATPPAWALETRSSAGPPFRTVRLRFRARRAGTSRVTVAPIFVPPPDISLRPPMTVRPPPTLRRLSWGTGPLDLSDRKPHAVSRVPEPSPFGSVGSRYRGRSTAAVARPCATR